MLSKTRRDYFNSLKRDDANEHVADADAGRYSWLTKPVTPAIPAPPVTRARLYRSESSDQREAIFRGATRVESHSESDLEDSNREDNDNIHSNTNRKRPRDDADESDDAELDSMISKCDMLHKTGVVCLTR
jgi:hypothetical protein